MCEQNQCEQIATVANHLLERRFNGPSHPMPNVCLMNRGETDETDSSWLLPPCEQHADPLFERTGLELRDL